MPSLRIITWNCRSGSISTRLSQLAAYSPHVVFLQECDPGKTLRPTGQTCSRRINRMKGIALVAPSSGYRCAGLRPRTAAGRATIAAAVTGRVSFTALGIWAQGADYVGDVLRTLAAHAGLLRRGPSVVMGDFNSGTKLADKRSLNRGHQQIVDELTTLGLVSAYHAFHRLEHGQETHPTYFHQFNPSRPWHIDFCFVPEPWAPRLVNVRVLEGDEWKARSDHRALLVDIETSSQAVRPDRPAPNAA